MFQTADCERMTTKIVPPDFFDYGIHPHETDVVFHSDVFKDTFAQVGIDLPALWKAGKGTTESQEARRHLTTLHTTASLLYSEWERACDEMDFPRARASGVYFNRTTRAARQLDKEHNLFDKRHIDKLEQKVALLFDREVRGEGANEQEYAQALAEAASQHTHERAWPWVMVPTFREQGYGRVVLRVIRNDKVPFPAYITQPTFPRQRATWPHSHGINRAYAAVLGSEVHDNIQWRVRSHQKPLPLQSYQRVSYSGKDGVVSIPPRAFHTISRKQQSAETQLAKSVLPATWFVSPSSLHLYVPDMSLVREVSTAGVDLSRFGEEQDMVMATNQGFFTAGGAASIQRRLEFGQNGEHCGMCFSERVVRQELDPESIPWLVDPAAPPARILTP